MVSKELGIGKFLRQRSLHFCCRTETDCFSCSNLNIRSENSLELEKVSKADVRAHIKMCWTAQNEFFHTKTTKKGQNKSSLMPAQTKSVRESTNKFLNIILP